MFFFQKILHENKDNFVSKGQTWVQVTSNPLWIRHCMQLLCIKYNVYPSIRIKRLLYSKFAFGEVTILLDMILSNNIIPPQMKILNMVIPFLLMYFCSFFSNWSVTSRIKQPVFPYTRNLCALEYSFLCIL